MGKRLKLLFFSIDRRISFLTMRMTPEQYFAVQQKTSPPLFYDLPVKPFHDVPPKIFRGRVVKKIYVQPNGHVDHTPLIIGVVAIVGLIVLGLAFMSRKG